MEKRPAPENKFVDFLTPHIVSSQQDLDKLTEEKKAQMDSAATGIGAGKVNYNYE